MRLVRGREEEEEEEECGVFVEFTGFLYVQLVLSRFLGDEEDEEEVDELAICNCPHSKIWQLRLCFKLSTHITTLNPKQDFRKALL